MTTMTEHLARAQISARLGEARQRRLGHQLALARAGGHRVGRRAAQAARRTSLSLTQAL